MNHATRHRLLLLLTMLACVLAPPAAQAATVRPVIEREHNALAGTLTIANRATLLREHRGATARYQWQWKQRQKWVPIRGVSTSRLTIPENLEADVLRVVVTFVDRHRHVAVASNTSASAPPPSHNTAAPAVNAALPTPYVPSSWSGPNPPTNCDSTSADDGLTDTDSMLITMDYCGATLEGLAPLPLPSNWAELTDTQRGFVLINLDRIERGQSAILGISTSLDGYAMQGADADTDPDPSIPSGDGEWFGSNWYGGTDSTDAVQGYLYDDGPGSNNLACSNGATWGCWGHRDNILGNASNPDLAAGLADGPNGDSTEIFGDQFSDFTFTWATELAAGYPQGLPTSVALTPATITQLTPKSKTITVSGNSLDTVTGVYFSNVADTNAWSCSTPDECSLSVPMNLVANSTYDLYLSNPAGLSAQAPYDQYTTAP